MTDELETKKPPRLTGGALRLAARLLETPGVGAPLYRLASKQLGIEVLRAAEIPADAPLFRFTHLDAAPRWGGEGNADA